MKVDGRTVIRNDNAAAASAVRKTPEDWRGYRTALTLVITELSNTSIVQPKCVVSGLQQWSPAFTLPNFYLTVSSPNPMHDILASTLQSGKSHRVYFAWPMRLERKA
jgi:hypothetical protein